MESRKLYSHLYESRLQLARFHATKLEAYVEAKNRG